MQNGANIGFNVPTNNAQVTFSYNSTTHVLTISTDNAPPPAGDVQWDGLRHDTFDSYYRSPFGAVPAGTSVTLRFRTAHFDVTGVHVRVYTFDPATGQTAGPVDHPMTFLENRIEAGTEYDIWTHTLATPAAPAILYYKFRVTDQADEDFYSDAYVDDHDNLNQGGAGAASDGEPFPAFQLTAYDPAFQTPAWLHHANVYQIFPDRFRNGDPSNDYCRPGSTAGCPTFYGDQTPLLREPWNTLIGDPRQPGEFQNEYGTQFYGGDLKGIENRLDYLQSVGVDTLYLNPIFKARSNHRYDTDDFLEVDPALGGDAALVSLKTEMERRGMRLILDGVFNHSSSDSVYFDLYHRYNAPDGGCESAASPYRGWFNFFNSNAPCSFGDYEAWFGFGSLPVFKDDSGPVRDFFYRTPGANVTQHWYERGAAGWRFDVANEISHDWWNEYRPLAKSYKADGPLVGEIWPDASQWLAGDQLDSVMNYRFRKNVLGFARGRFDWGDNDNSGGNRIVALSPSQFDRALRSVREDYPAQATAAMLNLIDSHDTNRSLYVLTIDGDNGLAQAKERLRLSALFQFTYMGAPMVYYGDEAALDAPIARQRPQRPRGRPVQPRALPVGRRSGRPERLRPRGSIGRRLLHEARAHAQAARVAPHRLLRDAAHRRHDPFDNRRRHLRLRARGRRPDRHRHSQQRHSRQHCERPRRRSLRRRRHAPRRARRHDLQRQRRPRESHARAPQRRRALRFVGRARGHDRPRRDHRRQPARQRRRLEQHRPRRRQLERDRQRQRHQGVALLG